jgi:addiction module HigA family antidote
MSEPHDIIAPLPPMHPGEMLREEFMATLGLTPGKIARACHVPRTRIERIVREELGISADTALRLARFFNTTPEFWMNLQKRYELLTTEMQAHDDLARITAFEAA